MGWLGKLEGELITLQTGVCGFNREIIDGCRGWQGGSADVWIGHCFWFTSTFRIQKKKPYLLSPKGYVIPQQNDFGTVWMSQ